jgi:ABC-2 type transport system ATP-binding protein
MSRFVLQTENLSKSFGKTEALQDVSLSIRQGEVCGLIGQNGAGKTTLLRLINGLMKPSEGIVRVETDKPYIGYMPQNCRFDDHTTVSDTLCFFARLRKTDADASISLCNKLKLDVRKKVRYLSPGQQKKLQITIAMIGEPDLFVLDEPTAGLDPAAANEMKGMIQDLHTNGKSILISSHILQDIEDVCTKVAILESGRLTYDQALESCFMIRISPVTGDVMAVLSTDYPVVADASGTTLTAQIEKEKIPNLIADLCAKGIDVFEVSASGVKNLVREKLRFDEGGRR